ncbi:hypothetical protein APHAL10511_005862 [Amanita phalloides]|nr:hypothetical protein APHAL10511_005862 [Amanita phalloides]
MHTLLSAGSNARGQLGNGSTDDSHTFQRCSFFGCDPGNLPKGTSRVISVSAGASHTIVLLEITDSSSNEQRKELWGCGSGQRGQLGPNFCPQRPFLNTSSHVFHAINLPLERYNLQRYSYKMACTAWETTYVALTCVGKGDVVISMGANDFGDLGIGGHALGKGCKDDSFHVIHLDHIEIDGLSLKLDTIVVLNLSAGQHHIVVHLHASLSDDSTRSFIVGWGTSRHGQLTNLSPGTEPGRAPRLLSKPKLINGSVDIIGLSLGMQHTVFLDALKAVSGIGSNRKGQLSTIESLTRVRYVACTWHGTYAIVDDEYGAWRIVSFGSNTHGQLGRIVPSDKVAVEFPDTVDGLILKGIACGSEHILCLLVTEAHHETEVWGWGWNEHGNLGIGSTNDIHVPVRILPMNCENTFNIIDIWAGCGTSWLYAMNSPVASITNRCLSNPDRCGFV